MKTRIKPLSVQTMPSRFDVDVDTDADVDAGVDNGDDEKLLQRFLMIGIGGRATFLSTASVMADLKEEKRCRN